MIGSSTQKTQCRIQKHTVSKLFRTISKFCIFIDDLHSSISYSSSTLQMTARKLTNNKNFKARNNMCKFETMTYTYKYFCLRVNTNFLIWWVHTTFNGLTFFFRIMCFQQIIDYHQVKNGSSENWNNETSMTEKIPRANSMHTWLWWWHLISEL